MLTTPELWEDEFLVLDVERPFGKLGEFTKALPPGLTKNSPLEEFQTAYEKANYMRTIDWVVDNFWKTAEAVAFYKSQDTGHGKIVLSLSEYEGVVAAKDALLNSPYTNVYFKSPYIEHEVLYQVPIFFEYKGVECKALLDGILINHKDKTIEPFDLKTIGKTVFEFPISYMQFGYFRQAAFYHHAVQDESSPVAHLLKAGYTLLDFVFVVVESNKDSLNPAVIFRTSEKDRERGFSGGHVRGKYYTGIDKLLDDYIFYKESDLWDLPKDLLESDGVMPLDIFD